MGCDIHGWIEINRFPTQHEPDGEFAWESAVDLGTILPRCYVVFGRLAHDGSRQQPGDRALFANRGIPELENLGKKTRKNYKYWEGDAHHESHFTHAELTQSRVTIGIGEKESKSVIPIDYCREGMEEVYQSSEAYEKEGWNNDMAYGRVRRAWEAAFGVSKSLASRYGIEQVRWVIWFDN